MTAPTTHAPTAAEAGLHSHLHGAGFRSTVDLGHGLAVVGIEGEESVSGSYRVEVLLSTPEPWSAEVMRDLLGAAAAVVFGDGPGELVCGVVTGLVRVHASANEAHYRVVVEPHVALLRHTVRSRAVHDRDVPGVVLDVLADHGLDRAWVRTHLQETYEARPYVVQWAESDLDFVQRWLAEEGLFHWYSHEAHGEVLEIADSAAVASSSRRTTELTWSDRSSLEHDAPVLFDLDETWQLGPHQALLHHVDEARAHSMLGYTAAVSAPEAWGSHAFYQGVGPRQDDVRQRWVRRRVEALAAPAITARGKTHTSSVRAGSVIRVPNGPGAERYLVVASRFRLGHPIGGRAAWTEGSERVRFTAELELVDLTRPYRPAPRPRPVAHGVFVGYVVADDGAELATPDAEGRYRVTLPWATPPSSDARPTLSIPLRVVQPTAGAGESAHFPMRQGTPVLVAHQDGDPDRPVILGAVPHGLTHPDLAPSPTAIHLQNAVGIRLELENRVRAGNG